MKSALCLGAIAVAVACAGAPPSAAPSPPPPPHAAPSPPPARAKVDAPAAPETPLAARLEPVPPTRDARAHVEILFPIAEQRILIPKAPGYVVRTKVDAWPRSPVGRGVVVCLDDNRPRRVLAKTEIKLGELVDDGHALSPGPHWLALAAVDENQALVRGNGGSRAPFSVVRFWIGERDAKRPPADSALLLAPAGTYNGEQAALSVDFLPVPELSAGRNAAVRVVGTGLVLEHRLSEWQPLRVSELPSGDYRVAVELAGARAARVVTINRDLK